MARRFRKFVDELQRRHVLRTAGAYIVAAWGLLQVVDLVGNPFGLTESGLRLLIITLVVAFIPVVLISWFYEITPSGFRADIAPQEGESAPPARRTAIDHAVTAALVVALSYIAIDTFFGPEPREPEWTLSTPLPFVSSIGFEETPTISPDGKFVAYFWFRLDEPRNIYIRAIDGFESTQLTDNDAWETSITWAPNGTKIAFLRANDIGSRDVRIIPKLGGTEELLHRIAPDIGQQGIDWSPDGNSLLFPDQDPASPHGYSAIFSFDLHTGALSQLTHPTLDPHAQTAPRPYEDGFPEISPDGERVAFIRDNADGELLCILELANGAVSCHGRGQDLFIADLDWLPDSANVLTIIERLQGVREISELSIKDGSWRSLYAMPNADELSVGSDKVIVSTETMNLNLWRIRGPKHPGAGEPERVSFSDQNEVWPSISPDGSRLVYVSDQAGEPAIWVANIDGSGRRPIVSEGVGHHPRWSPDGKHIVYTGDRQSESTNKTEDSILQIDAEGGYPAPVLERAATASLSKDGEWLYFHYLPDEPVEGPCASTYSIYRQSVSGGERQLIVPCRIYPIVGYNERLYFLNNLDGASIESSDLEGGDRRVEVTSLRGTYWDVSQKHIVYLGSGKDRVLRVKNIETGITREWSGHFVETGVPPIPYLWSLSVTPDDEWIVYTRKDEQRVDLKIADLTLE